MVLEIVEANPGITALQVHDELLDMPLARWSPTKPEVRCILRSMVGTKVNVERGIDKHTHHRYYALKRRHKRYKGKNFN